MLTARSSHRRGGVLALTVAGLALVSMSAAAALSFSKGTSASEGKATNEKELARAAETRRLQPGEVATVLHLIGLSPEALASAGVSGLQCDDLFSTATAYCLQAERLTQLQIAHGNINQANHASVHPGAPWPLDGDGHAMTMVQCQTALSDLESAAIRFVTVNLDAGTIAKLSAIRANRSWGLPMPYMTVSRTDQQWLALRGALVARRFAQNHGVELSDAPAAVLSAAESDDTVAQALRDYAANLANVKASFASH